MPESEPLPTPEQVWYDVLDQADLTAEDVGDVIGLELADA